MNNLGIFMESMGIIDGVTWYTEISWSSDNARCLDWRSEAIFKLKGLTLISLKLGLTLISHFVDDSGEILHSVYFIMASQSGTGNGALASTSTDSEGQAHDKNTRSVWKALCNFGVFLMFIHIVQY